MIRQSTFNPKRDASGLIASVATGTQSIGKGTLQVPGTMTGACTLSLSPSVMYFCLSSTEGRRSI
jgi:hypothetical protein